MKISKALLNKVLIYLAEDESFPPEDVEIQDSLFQGLMDSMKAEVINDQDPIIAENYLIQLEGFDADCDNLDKFAKALTLLDTIVKISSRTGGRTTDLTMWKAREFVRDNKGGGA